jgi:hypothetical protein
MSEKPVKVNFQGRDLWFLEDNDGSGALAPLDHCDGKGRIAGLDVVFEDSFAHVFEDGRILRYGKEIGRKKDLTVGWWREQQ